MNRLDTLLAGASMLAIMASGETFAQQATPVTKTATPNATASFFVPATPATACSTTANTSAAETITITPGSNQYVYVTGVYIDMAQNVTGATGVVTGSFTNMLNSPSYSLAVVAATAGDNGSFRQISETYDPPLRSSTPGTAVTWLPSAAMTNSTYLCPRITAYFAQ